MSDLISRGALIEALQKKEKECEDRMIMPSWYSAMKVIREQTTAYDVDKIVEELESRAEANEDISGRLKGLATKRQRDSWLQRASAFRKAIEIVKGGGVNERD